MMDMQSNPQPEPVQADEDADRRHAPRTDVGGRYSMRLDPGGGREPIHCTLLDFSVTGVRLKLPEDVALPQNVQILIGGLSHNCRIAWRKGTMVGVDFVDEHHSIF
jgi:hypothetical protein